MDYLLHWLGGSREPYLAEFRRSEMLVIFTVSAASFSILFIYATFLPMLPDVLKSKIGIVDDFELQFWSSTLISVYAASVTLGTSVSAIFSHTRGAGKPLFLLSLLLFFVGTLLLPLSPNIILLCAGRVLQGFAASLLRSTSMSLLLHRLGHSFLPRVIKWLTASSHAATNVGPVMGGVLADKEGLWGGFVAMFVALGIVGILRTAILDDEKDVRKKSYFGRIGSWWKGKDDTAEDEEDSRSVAKATAAAFGVEGADEETPLLAGSAAKPSDAGVKAVAGGENVKTSETEYPLTSSSVLNVVSSVGESSASGNEPPPTTVTTELQTTTTTTTLSSGSTPFSTLPIILLLLKSPRVISALLGIFIQGGILASFDATLPLFVQRKFSFGLTGAGLALLALSAPGTFLALPLSLAAAAKGRWRGYISSFGFLVSIPALYFLGTLEGSEESTPGVFLLCVLLGILGFSMHLIPSPLTHDLADVIKQLEAENPGVFNPVGGGHAYADAVMHWVNHVALLVGPAVAGLSALSGGWGLMCDVMLGLSCLGAVMTGAFTGAQRATGIVAGGHDEEGGGVVVGGEGQRGSVVSGGSGVGYPEQV